MAPIVPRREEGGKAVHAVVPFGLELDSGTRKCWRVSGSASRPNLHCPIFEAALACLASRGVGVIPDDRDSVVRCMRGSARLSVRWPESLFCGGRALPPDDAVTANRSITLRSPAR